MELLVNTGGLIYKRDFFQSTHGSKSKVDNSLRETMTEQYY